MNEKNKWAVNCLRCYTIQGWDKSCLKHSHIMFNESVSFFRGIMFNGQGCEPSYHSSHCCLLIDADQFVVCVCSVSPDASSSLCFLLSISEIGPFPFPFILDRKAVTPPVSRSSRCFRYEITFTLKHNHIAWQPSWLLLSAPLVSINLTY